MKKNQISINNQDGQQAGQNQISQFSALQEKPRVNPWMFFIVALILLLVGGGIFYFFKFNSQKKQADNKNITPTLTAESGETTQIATPVQSKEIIFPFVRDGSVYIYDKGAEKLLVSPTQKTTQSACYNIVYPFISPNKKYVAYIEQNGSTPGYGGCLEGILKVIHLDTGKIITTSYKTGYFKWNSFNQIIFNQGQEKHEVSQAYIVKKIFYDPANETETIFNTVTDQDKTWADRMVLGEFPFSINKLIRYKEDKYYLIDKLGNKETFLFNKDRVERFLDWSPSGRYAIFESSEKSTGDFDALELVVDTQDLNTQPKEIKVGRGGAGGDFSTGRKWYFEEGFVAYCRQDLYFIDGSEPLQLTSDGGGGCHNEEGFVATSPDGNYAFLKFKDRFELRSKNGEVEKIIETTKLVKGRLAPKNLIWLNNDNMIIFQSTRGGGSSYPEPPSIYLFERKSNTIKLILQNGYLIENSP